MLGTSVSCFTVIRRLLSTIVLVKRIIDLEIVAYLRASDLDEPAAVFFCCTRSGNRVADINRDNSLLIKCYSRTSCGFFGSRNPARCSA